MTAWASVELPKRKCKKMWKLERMLIIMLKFNNSNTTKPPSMLHIKMADKSRIICLIHVIGIEFS